MCLENTKALVYKISFYQFVIFLKISNFTNISVEKISSMTFLLHWISNPALIALSENFKIFDRSRFALLQFCWGWFDRSRVVQNQAPAALWNLLYVPTSNGWTLFLNCPLLLGVPKLIHAFFFIRNDKKASSTRSFLIFNPFLVPKIS